MELRRESYRIQMQAVELRRSRRAGFTYDGDGEEASALRREEPVGSDAWLTQFVEIRSACADLEERAEHLERTLGAVRRERTILGIEAEALGRRMSGDA